MTAETAEVTPEECVKAAIREWLAAGRLDAIFANPALLEKEIATMIRAGEDRGYGRRQREISDAVHEAGGRIVLVWDDAAGVMVERVAAPPHGEDGEKEFTILFRATAEEARRLFADKRARRVAWGNAFDERDDAVRRVGMLVRVARSVDEENSALLEALSDFSNAKGGANG